MSIKTLRKRIALVAVSALGVGLLSVAPASAAPTAGVGEFTVSALCNITNAAGTAAPNDATSPYTSGHSAGVAITIPVGSTITLEIFEGEFARIFGSRLINLDGAISVATAGTDPDYGTYTLGTDGNNLLSADTDVTSDAGTTFRLQAVSVGSVTIAVAATAAATLTPTVANSIAVTVVAACSTGEFSAAYSDVSTVDSGTDSSWTANVDEALAASAGTSLYIRVDGDNAYNANLTTGTYFAQATNGALLNWGGSIGTAPLKGVATAATLASDADGAVVLRVDPASAVNGGSTTVTITHNGTAVTTKTLTFFAEAKSISVNTVRAGRTNTSNGSSNASGYILYTFKDASGNTVPGSAAAFATTSASQRIPTATSLKAPTIAATSTGVASSGLADAQETIIGSTASGVMNYDCGTSAGTQAFTIYAINDVTGDTLTATVNAACYGGNSTYAVSMDKAAYKVGEVATITITAKDSGGNPVSDNTTLPASSVSVGGGALTATIAGTEVFTGGTITLKAQITTAGSFNTVVAIPGTVTGSATAAYTVTDGAVSNAEVLAAIVKLIASINKQIKALQKSLRR